MSLVEFMIFMVQSLFHRKSQGCSCNRSDRRLADCGNSGPRHTSWKCFSTLPDASPRIVSKCRSRYSSSMSDCGDRRDRRDRRDRQCSLVRTSGWWHRVAPRFQRSAISVCSKCIHIQMYPNVSKCSNVHSCSCDFLEQDFCLTIEELHPASAWPGASEGIEKSAALNGPNHRMGKQCLWR